MLYEVAGMDPSMSNWGIAKGTLDTKTGEIEIRELVLIVPERITTKQVRQNSKDINIAMDLCVGISKTIGTTNKLTFVEVPHGSQSSRAMASYGICVALIGAYTVRNPSTFQVSASDNKRIFTGKKNATKEEMIQRMLELHPETRDMIKYHKGNPVGWTEHLADAVAAIHAGAQSREFRQAFGATYLTTSSRSNSP